MNKEQNKGMTRKPNSGNLDIRTGHCRSYFVFIRNQLQELVQIYIWRNGLEILQKMTAFNSPVCFQVQDNNTKISRKAVV